MSDKALNLDRTSFDEIIKLSIADMFKVVEFDDVFEKIARENVPFGGAIGAILFQFPSLRRLSRVLSLSDVVFLHVPRNAGTTISISLYGYPISHRSLCFFEYFLDRIMKKKHVFSTIREPESRFLSAVSFFRSGGTQLVPMSKRFRSVMEGLDSIDTLLDYLEGSKSVFMSDHVFRPQKWYIEDGRGRTSNVTLFRIDRDKSRLLEFLQNYGVRKVDVLNQRVFNQAPLSKTQKRRVEKLYCDDFNIYESIKY